MAISAKRTVEPFEERPPILGFFPLRWDAAENWLILTDQRKVPSELVDFVCKNLDEVAFAIKDMVVRGAPVIGAAAAYGMVIAAFAAKFSKHSEFLASLEAAKKTLDSSRPTAVNLMWATAHMLRIAALPDFAALPLSAYAPTLLSHAHFLMRDNCNINFRLAEAGLDIIPSFPSRPANLIHHCNTGPLATGDIGTALGVIFYAHLHKRPVHVYVDETRPRLQGARLTTWELQKVGVPFHLIADNASGLLMWLKKVDLVIFGADRVALNGDVINKVGSYKLAVVAKENGIPCYSAVPTPTIDANIEAFDAAWINQQEALGKPLIESRNPEEVTGCVTTTDGWKSTAPPECPAVNPSFDITPNKYLTGIITEEGICYPPYHISLRKAKEKAENRFKQAVDEQLKKISSELRSQPSPTPEPAKVLHRDDDEKHDPKRSRKGSKGN